MLKLRPHKSGNSAIKRFGIFFAKYFKCFAIFFGIFFHFSLSLSLLCGHNHRKDIPPHRAMLMISVSSAMCFSVLFFSDSAMLLSSIFTRLLSRLCMCITHCFKLLWWLCRAMSRYCCLHRFSCCCFNVMCLLIVKYAECLMQSEYKRKIITRACTHVQVVCSLSHSFVGNVNHRSAAYLIYSFINQTSEYENTRKLNGITFRFWWNAHTNRLPPLPLILLLLLLLRLSVRAAFFFARRSLYNLHFQRSLRISSFSFFQHIKL